MFVFLCTYYVFILFVACLWHCLTLFDYFAGYVYVCVCCIHVFVCLLACSVCACRLHWSTLWRAQHVCTCAHAVGETPARIVTAIVAIDPGRASVKGHKECNVIGWKCIRAFWLVHSYLLRFHSGREIVEGKRKRLVRQRPPRQRSGIRSGGGCKHACWGRRMLPIVDEGKRG